MFLWPRKPMFTIFFFLASSVLLANPIVPLLPDEGVVSGDNHHLMDATRDYAYFIGRMSDRVDDNQFLKIATQEGNIIFFRSGDPLQFKINRNDKKKWCQAKVSRAESGFLSIEVLSFDCVSKAKMLRRGSILHFYSPQLSERVQEVAQTRQQLIQKKADFLGQLSEINQFLWTYEERRLQVAAQYEKQIVELLKQKRQALNEILVKKKDKIELQSQLQTELKSLDGQLKYYRIERQEQLFDRWNADQDSGLPFKRRPQKLENLASESLPKKD